MDVDAPRGLLRFFQDLPDPRAANARHRLVDIMAIALMAVLSKAQDWIEVEAWPTSFGWPPSWICPTAFPATTPSAGSLPVLLPRPSRACSAPG